MTAISLKTHYSVYEIAAFKLKTAPNAPKNILEKAKREGWCGRKRTGKGGGYEYALTSMPEEIQTELRTRFAQSIVEAKPKAVPAKIATDLRQLSERQLNIADARAALAQYVLALEQGRKRVRQSIIEQVVDQITLKKLPESLLALVPVANARSKGAEQLSVRSLKTWVIAYEKADTPQARLQNLAPQEQGRKVLEVASLAWLHDFLSFYQTFTNLSVAHAYKRFAKAYGETAPSLNQVRNAVAKLPTIVLQRGRLTSVAYKQLLPYVKRDWSVFAFGEMYVGDGHGFKAKIRHPDTGAPFQPEVTAIMDARTRLIVGWSIHKSESVIAVADALRHAISQHGLPLIYYSDNGGGEKNKTFDADITGLLPRLGIHHETGLPGNAQGRGLIERVWKTTLIPLAREYETYVGKSVDKSTAHLIHRKVESATKALLQGKAMNPEQKRYYRKLPTFEEFIADVAHCFAEYNASPHSSLPKKADKTRYSPLEYQQWIMEKECPEQRKMDALELDLLYRPEEIRTVHRGIVEFRTNQYFSLALAEYHGKKVRVAYDIHDASYVIVKQMDGKWIGRAEFEGNKVAGFAESVRDQAKRKSIEASVKRKMEQADRQKLELNPVVTIEQKPSFDLLEGLNNAPSKTQKPEPLFILQTDRDDYLTAQQANK